MPPRCAADADARRNRRHAESDAGGLEPRPQRRPILHGLRQAQGMGAIIQSLAILGVTRLMASHRVEDSLTLDLIFGGGQQLLPVSILQLPQACARFSWASWIWLARFDIWAARLNLAHRR
jgi:hypothetical protein